MLVFWIFEGVTIGPFVLLLAVNAAASWRHARREEARRVRRLDLRQARREGRT